MGSCFSCYKGNYENETTSTLLTMPQPVVECILKYVCQGKYGGASSLLALRKVCRLTKNWVDYLPKDLSEIGFSECLVCLDFKSFPQFMKMKIPFQITQLSIAEINLWKSTENNEVWKELISDLIPRLKTLYLKDSLNFLLTSKKNHLEVLSATSHKLTKLMFSGTSLTSAQSLVYVDLFSFMSEDRMPEMKDKYGLNKSIFENLLVLLSWTPNRNYVHFDVHSRSIELLEAINLCLNATDRGSQEVSASYFISQDLAKKCKKRKATRKCTGGTLSPDVPLPRLVFDFKLIQKKKISEL